MRCTGYEMAWYKGTQASHLYEKSMHTLCTIQWATAPGRSLNYPRPKSITRLRTFSDNGVYVALQLFLVILVSDQWRRVLIPYSYRQAPWGLLHARGWLSRYTWDQQLYVVYESRETHSPMLKARFLHLTNLVAQPESNPRPLDYQANVLPLGHGSLYTMVTMVDTVELMDRSGELPSSNNIPDIQLFFVPGKNYTPSTGGRPITTR